LHHECLPEKDMTLTEIAAGCQSGAASDRATARQPSAAGHDQQRAVGHPAEPRQHLRHRHDHLRRPVGGEGDHLASEDICGPQLTFVPARDLQERKTIREQIQALISHHGTSPSYRQPRLAELGAPGPRERLGPDDVRVSRARRECLKPRAFFPGPSVV
jgi:hypothetical protein